MDTKILVIYHSPCQDGFAAAWAVYRRFGDDAEYFPGVYGEQPPDVTGRHVILVDFSYPANVLLTMAETALSVLVLDHHKSAKEALEGFLPANTTWQGHLAFINYIHKNEGFTAAARVAVQFDMERSGAVMAWEYFHPDLETPRLLLHVQDRDLWLKKMSGTREISAAVFSHPYKFSTWDNLVTACGDNYWRNKMIDEGAAIIRQHDKDIAELIPATRRLMHIGGYKVPVANMPYMMASDAGNIMAVGHPFAATYYDGRTHRHFSLRSQESGIDVSEVAKKYGGGGHAHAAGFRVELGWDGDLDWGTAEVP